MSDQTENHGSDVTTAEAELAWLHNGLNRERLAKLAEAEIEEARTATPQPRFWVAIDIDEALLR
jgi:hypothetical protein